jgi:hypothetical protein
MTTKEQLLDGLRMVIREGTRASDRFTADDWDYQVHDDDGAWTAKQIYCHVTAVAEVGPILLQRLIDAGADTNAAAGLDVDGYNAQTVAAKATLSPDDLRQSFKSAYEKLIDFVQGVPEDQLQQPRKFLYLAAPLADIIQTATILHALSHIYNAQSRPGVLA